MFGAACIIGVGEGYGAEAQQNLIRNSSFEAGIDSKFSIGRWIIDGLPSVSLDSTTKVHGDFSAKVPFSYRYGKIRNSESLFSSFRSAVPVPLVAGKRYYFSVYLKSDGPIKAELVLTPNRAAGYRDQDLVVKPVLVGETWKRYGMSFTSRKTEDAYWEINAQSAKPGYVWIDALQLEEGTSATDYKPHDEVEAGLTSAEPGKIYAPGKPIGLTLGAYNNSLTEAAARKFSVVVNDIRGREVHRDTMTLSLPARSRSQARISIPPLKNGIYRCSLFKNGDNAAEGTLNFSVLPEPRPVPADESSFGLYLTLAPEPLDIMRRVGFSWIGNMTSNSHLNYWDSVEKTAGKYYWYDEDLAEATRKGYRFMFNLEPYKAPRWARALTKADMIARWSEYVSAMVTHYKDTVKYWTISDEAEVDERDTRELRDSADKRNYWRNAREYAEWHKAGFRAIKAADPGAKVILNASPEFAEKVLKVLPAGYVDVLATNAYMIPAHIEKIRALGQAYGINEIWAPGVGPSSFSYYEDHLSAQQRASLANTYWSDQSRQVAINVIDTLSHGARRLLHYTGTYVGNTNEYSLFEADSGLKPLGSVFGGLIWLLDGSDSASEMTTSSIEKQTKIFRFWRKDGNVVFAIYREPSVPDMEMVLPDNEEIHAYDYFGNSLPVRHASGKWKVAISSDPVFVIAPRSHASLTGKQLGSVSMLLKGLPQAKTTEIAGRYAKLTGLIDKNLWRPDPNISLWYNSASRGWIEILRFRSSDYLPAYRVTDSGFEITWNFTRQASAFHLEPGGFPADLVQDAVFWASHDVSGIRQWSKGVIDVRRGNANARPSSAPPGRNFSNALNYLIKTNHSIEIKIETTLMGDAGKYNGQARVFGGWPMLTRNDNECFLHMYYAPSAPAPMSLRTKISAVDIPGK